MKAEQGLVIEVNNDIAKVRVGRHSDCKNCGGCPGNDSIIICADNKIGAKPGQRVAFEVKDTNVISSAFIVFILPLIAVFVGVMIGEFIGENFGFNVPMFQVIGGIVALALSIISIRVFDKTAKDNKKSQPVIVRIL